MIRTVVFKHEECFRHFLQMVRVYRFPLETSPQTIFVSVTVSLGYWPYLCLLSQTRALCCIKYLLSTNRMAFLSDIGAMALTPPPYIRDTLTK